jgi:hypothetical protein
MIAVDVVSPHGSVPPISLLFRAVPCRKSVLMFAPVAETVTA